MKLALSVVSALALCSAVCLAARQDPTADARKAIEKVRAQKSYRTEFKATIQAPNSDAMQIAGNGVWVSGGVLFISYNASGGDVKRIVRVGEQAWVYHEPGEEWVNASELGMGGAGRGVQNPDEVLSVLAKHLDLAKSEGPGAIHVALSGTDIEKIMKEQANQGSFDWKNSTANARVQLSADGLISQMKSDAALASTDPAIAPKKVQYTADVKVVAFNDRFTMTFQVEGAPIAIGAKPLAAIADRPGIPKELADEVAKLIDRQIATCIAELGDPDKKEFAMQDLEALGKRAVPALEKAAQDPKTAQAARQVLDKIAKK